MSQQELLAKVVTVLERLGVEYMVTGSYVSGMQGEPRSTHDVDLVVALQPTVVGDLVAAFPEPDYYLDQQSVLGAIKHRGMFNLLDINDGSKVDFWMLTDEPFDRSRFGRKYRDDLFGLSVHVTSPEDTILMKLHWAQESGGSEKQFTDALRVYEIQHGQLDQDYLDQWSKQLKVEKYLQRVRSEAKPP